MSKIVWAVALLVGNFCALSTGGRDESVLGIPDQYPNTTIVSPTSSALKVVKQLQPPSTDVILGGEVEGIDFWQEHETVLHQAWEEWWKSHHHRFPPLLEHEIMNSELYSYIHMLWKNPTVDHEQNARSSFWSEPIPGVFVCRNFFSTMGIRAIRQHFTELEQVPIPKRRPNGMNRDGIVIDDATPGGVSYEGLLSFRNWLVNSYFRPLGRMFFPEFSGRGERDDIEAYAFTVQYHAADYDDVGYEPTTSLDYDEELYQPPSRRPIQHDVKLLEHSDASLFTLSINLNLPEESFNGSEVLFAMSNEDGGSPRSSIRCEPGMAILHRGLHRHEAQPIIAGSRYQLILWLFGDHGYVRFEPYGKHERRDVIERWTRVSQTDPIHDVGTEL